MAGYLRQIGNRDGRVIAVTREERTNGGQPQHQHQRQEEEERDG